MSRSVLVGDVEQLGEIGLTLQKAAIQLSRSSSSGAAALRSRATTNFTRVVKKMFHSHLVQWRPRNDVWNQWRLELMSRHQLQSVSMIGRCVGCLVFTTRLVVPCA
ncbi:MAG: hypothetical protein GY820_10570 [Gammaproteobacteria bacterium]|nr:hypothetical protein [Gammaproteobacteria bacterium]